MKSKVFLVLFIFFLVLQSQGQTISFDQFIEQVKTHHPIIKQADFELELGDANLLFARGSFDPELVSSIREKYFSEDRYYSELNAAIQIPTWFGIEFESGYDRNIGNFVTPNGSTSNNGLLYAGVSVPLGKGLFVDKRRNELAKAKIYKESTLAQQNEQKNQLVFDAAQSYWRWFEAWNSMKIYEDAVQISEQRFKAIVSSVALGDRSPIDTVEAKIQLQNRQIQLQLERVNVENARLFLAGFLWLDGMVPLELTNDAIPISVNEVSRTPLDNDMLESQNSLLENHPTIRRQSLAIESLGQELKYKKEQLKPKLDVKYRPLSSAGSEFSAQNYSWGVDLAIPLFLRSARGQIALTSIKIKQSDLKLTNKRVQLKIKLSQAFNKWELSNNQYVQQNSVVNNYQVLVQGERQLFEGGESSLFLVNQREQAYFKSRIKLNSLLVKNQLSAVEAKFIGGLRD